MPPRRVGRVFPRSLDNLLTFDCYYILRYRHDQDIFLLWPRLILTSIFPTADSGRPPNQRPVRRPIPHVQLRPLSRYPRPLPQAMTTTNIRSGGISRAGHSLSELEKRIVGPGNLGMVSKRKATADGFAKYIFIRIPYTYIISKLMVFIIRIIICSITTGFALCLAGLKGLQRGRQIPRAGSLRGNRLSWNLWSLIYTILENKQLQIALSSTSIRNTSGGFWLTGLWPRITPFLLLRRQNSELSSIT